MLVLVTGASAGFGAAISRLLVKNGHRVIGCARRAAKLEQLQLELGADFYPLAVDISSTPAIQKAIETLPAPWRSVDVLVNNAGLALGLDAAQQADFADWQQMIDTNIVGTIFLTKLLLPLMIARKSGVIINMGSIAGTYPYPGGNVYGATKAFIKQFSLNLRADLSGTGIRVTNIEPGLCGGTEFSQVRFKGDETKAAAVYEGVEFVTAADIANTVYWVIQQPAHININSIEIMPVAQSFAPLTVAKKN